MRNADKIKAIQAGDAVVISGETFHPYRVVVLEDGTRRAVFDAKLCGPMIQLGSGSLRWGRGLMVDSVPVNSEAETGSDALHEAAEYLNARARWCDQQAEHWGITPEGAQRFRTQAEVNRVGAVIVRALAAVLPVSDVESAGSESQ